MLQFRCVVPDFGGVTPPSPDYTPASPDYSPASDSESDLSEDPLSDHIPPLPATSPFLSSNDDTTNSDTLDTPPSPTHGMPFTEITSSTQRSPADTYDDCEEEGWTVTHSSSYCETFCRSFFFRFVIRGIIRFHLDASSDSSSRHSLSDHSSPNLPSISMGPYRKRRRSPMASVSALPLVSRALSHVYTNLVPSPKRVRDSGYLADVDVDPSEVRLGVDVEDESFEQSRSRGTDLEVDDDVEMSVRDPIVVSDDGDIPPVVPEVIEGVQREQGHMIFGVESAVTALTKRITELERGNKRLKGTASVESERVDRL
ncbi:hypothetical protein Tco_0035875 [Tanacetum coccineum]